MFQIQTHRVSPKNTRCFPQKRTVFQGRFDFVFIYISVIFRRKITDVHPKNQWNFIRKSLIFTKNLTEILWKNQWNLFEKSLIFALKISDFWLKNQWYLPEKSVTFISKISDIYLKYHWYLSGKSLRFIQKISDILPKNHWYLYWKPLIFVWKISGIRLERQWFSGDFSAWIWMIVRVFIAECNTLFFEFSADSDLIHPMNSTDISYIFAWNAAQISRKRARNISYLRFLLPSQKRVNQKIKPVCNLLHIVILVYRFSQQKKDSLSAVLLPEQYFAQVNFKRRIANVARSAKSFGFYFGKIFITRLFFCLRKRFCVYSSRALMTCNCKLRLSTFPVMFSVIFFALLSGIKS